MLVETCLDDSAWLPTDVELELQEYSFCLDSMNAVIKVKPDPQGLFGYFLHTLSISTSPFLFSYLSIHFCEFKFIIFK